MYLNIAELKKYIYTSSNTASKPCCSADGKNIHDSVSDAIVSFTQQTERKSAGVCKPIYFILFFFPNLCCLWQHEKRYGNSPILLMRRPARDEETRWSQSTHWFLTITPKQIKRCARHAGQSYCIQASQGYGRNQSFTSWMMKKT